MLPEQLRLTDGTIVRRCPTDKPLYCSRAGRFYSIHGMAITDEGCVMHEVRPSFSPIRRKRWRSSSGIGGTQYPVMRHFDCMNCHTLMALTWIGPRPEGMEIDHLNGDRCDCSADNLQYVTPAENNRRRTLLNKLRAAGINPACLTTKRLLAFFAMPKDRFDRWLTDWTKRQADLVARELALRDPILYHLSQSPDEC